MENNKPVQQVRPNSSIESIMTPPTEKEVKEAVKGINMDTQVSERG